jgi:hypothetical protein
VVDGDALEMRFGESRRGFESPPLRFESLVLESDPLRGRFLVLGDEYAHREFDAECRSATGDFIWG